MSNENVGIPMSLKTETAAVALRKHYRECVEKFLKTVVVFDDRAFEPRAKQAPDIQETASSSEDNLDFALTEPANIDDVFSTPISWVSEQANANIASTDESQAPDEIPSEPLIFVPENANTHDLDGPSLIRRFASKGILCAVEQPDQNAADEAILEQIAELSNTADVVVLDWALSKQNPIITRTAIEDIFRADDKIKGRLRLIVIYTAEASGDIMQQLHGIADLTRIEGGNILGLKRPNAIVVIMNKPGGANKGVELTDLPEKIIDAYVEISTGLLPSSAVRAIGIIRENTHHFLSQFTSQLDGAYVAHKSQIPEGEDAEGYFIDLYADSLRNLMLLGGASKALSEEKCALWIRDQGASWTAPQIKAIIDTLGKNSAESENNFRSVLKIKSSAGIEALMKFIYSPGDHTEALKRMHSLSNFSRLSTDHIDIAASPRLHLGTVVAISNSLKPEEDIFLLCVQPRCDSIRLSGICNFPFLRLSNEKKNLLCIPWRGDAVYRSVEKFPRHLEMIAFGEQGKETPAIISVHGERATAEWTFTTAETPPRSLIWVGELRRDKAQKIASDLAARLHAPGFEEFEGAR